MKIFQESLDTAVFTTKFVLEQQSPILIAYHNGDGSWQFSGKEDDLSNEDFRVISLGEIIELDKSLLDLCDMPINSEASRLSIISPWKIVVSN
jgi:hypothetical protein